MSEIQQRMDDAGEAISQDIEEIVDMIHALTRRVSFVEHQLEIVTQENKNIAEENKNIEKELDYWRRINNPRPPNKVCANIQSQAPGNIERSNSHYKPSHPQITLGGYNAKSSRE